MGKSILENGARVVTGALIERIALKENDAKRVHLEDGMMPRNGAILSLVL